MTERLTVTVDQDRWGSRTLVAQRGNGPVCYCVQGFIGKALGLSDQQMGFRPDGGSNAILEPEMMRGLDVAPEHLKLIERGTDSDSVLWRCMLENDNFTKPSNAYTVEELKTRLAAMLEPAGIDLIYTGDPARGPMHYDMRHKLDGTYE